jgi:sulfur-oxidizing protein SoxB
LNRREFLHALSAAAACGLPLHASPARAQSVLYELTPFGNVSLLHFTDCHAQLLPVWFREPSANLGVGDGVGKPPHLTGAAFLSAYNIPLGSDLAYAFTQLGFAEAALQFGKMGGFAHLATLVKRLRASRPHALLLDGGDSWQGSATALWTQGRDMIAASRALGVDLMTAHWEFTYGEKRMQEGVKELAPIEFLAQNVKTSDFEEPVFKPWVMRESKGVPFAVIGQAFPYVPIAHPRRFVENWTFGIQERELQKHVEDARAKGAQAVVLLSHNGMDVDLKLASRLRGIDAILGGHTHDGVPLPVIVKNPGGQTIVTNAGSNGKFLGVLDLDVKAGRVADFRYRLLPVFSELIPPDASMAGLIKKLRAPYKEKLEEKLAVTAGLLYRRGNFNGTFDQLFLDALMQVNSAPIAFSPGFRWGTTLLPGEAITREHLMDQAAITYPMATLNEIPGAQIKVILEEVADNLFKPDPYYQQGGDMVRVGGLTYTCDPRARMGQRISDLRLAGLPLEADKRYRVAGWAPVAEGATGEPVWDVVERWLRERKVVSPRQPNLPKLVGTAGNPGIS